MNIPFHLLPLETKVQVIVAYADMALVAVGRFLQVAVPLVLVAMIVFLFPYPKRRRRWRR